MKLLRKSMMWVHTSVIYIWTTCATIVLGILAIAVSFFSKKGNGVHVVARFWAKSILAVSFLRTKIRGWENIEDGKSYIFMANHQSNYDIPTALGCLVVEFRWLAKAELFRIPIFGRAMRGAGYISIDRSDRKSAFESLKKAATTIREGVSVLIFPEGTRSEDGKVLPFKKGGFYLALDAGVPIVPIVISGTHEVMPKHHFLVRTGGAVTIDIMPPIETAQYTRKEMDLLIEKVRNVMVETLDKQNRGEWPC